MNYYLMVEPTLELRAWGMIKERPKQSFKLRLLAFVLALALLWYSVNPAPRPVTRIKRKDEPPDEKKREAEPSLQRAAVLPLSFAAPQAALKDTLHRVEDDEDDFEWPEYIDA
jgi:hypothetical protein